MSTLTFCKLLALAFLIGSFPLGSTEIAFDRNRLFQVFSGKRVRAQQVLERTFIHDLAALAPCVRTHVHDMVCHFNDVGIVFYHENRISSIAQLLKKFIQTMHIARVKADAGLVEHIHHVHEAAAQVFDDLHTLRFATGERVCFAI